MEVMLHKKLWNWESQNYQEYHIDSTPIVSLYINEINVEPDIEGCNWVKHAGITYSQVGSDSLLIAFTTRDPISEKCIEKVTKGCQANVGHIEELRSSVLFLRGTVISDIIDLLNEQIELQNSKETYQVYTKTDRDAHTTTVVWPKEIIPILNLLLTLPTLSSNIVLNSSFLIF